jgi:glycosyltransferase involved in cell wall biosynthesis
MKVGILGSRGIPNRYGGFEQFAGELAKGLKQLGCEVYVYNSHNHPYQKSEWEGVNIIHKYDPEFRIGLSGQFIYDFNCILDSRRRKFDVLLQLGYTTNSVWGFLLPRKAVKVCNPDGMEWQRSKYPAIIKRFLKRAEKWAVKSNDYLIADSKVIQKYYKQKYNKPTDYAAYPAEIFRKPDSEILKEYRVMPDKYNLLIARMQPDNNIETILAAYTVSQTDEPLLVIGNYENSYGDYLKSNYTDSRIRFLGAIYKQDDLNNLRHFSHLYFHGHSAGGTNPSLLEAMACSALVCAHDNSFNNSVLGQDAFYFKNTQELAELLLSTPDKEKHRLMLNNNREKIIKNYSPKQITDAYYQVFKTLLEKKQTKTQYAQR